MENVTPKSENFHSQLTSFNYHSETPACESDFHSPHGKLSSNGVKTLTPYGENCHSSCIHQWKRPQTPVENITQYTARTFTHNWQLSPRRNTVRLSHTPVESITPKSENFHPRFTKHIETLTHESKLSLTTLKTLTHCGENSHPTRWEISPNAVVTLTRQSENSHPPEC